MSKIISCEEIGEFDTYDLEVEHPDHQYYLANGVLTSNSHSVSYSFISYYTAWLRYHYPTEFMCALLNSEDPNSDKMQEYVDECRKMDIKVLPPDLNLSDNLNKITGDKEITSGLSSIKGLGSKAADNILVNRPYINFVDFLARNPSKHLRKNVIQALAKAGATDSLGVARKDAHENYQDYRVKINNLIKKHLAQVQLDNDEEDDAEAEDIKFIDEDNTDEVVEPVAKDKVERYYNDEMTEVIKQLSLQVAIDKTVEEWDRKTILINERVALGRSISGSLHEAFKGFFTGGYSITKFSDIKNLEAGSKIRIEAIIKAMKKEFKIKQGKNLGKKFAKYIVEDAYGNTSGLTLWAEDYEKFRTHLTDGIPFKAICKVSEYMGEKDLVLSTLERVYGRQL